MSGVSGRRPRALLGARAALVVLLAALVAPPPPPASALFADTGAVETRFQTAAPLPLAFGAVEAGDAYSLGITGAGRLFAWGRNANGQLGVGDTLDRLEPTPVVFPGDTPVLHASAGANLSIAVLANGDVYTWGNADLTEGPTPTLVPQVSGIGVTGVSAGGFFFLAWTADGALFSWGNTGSGRLGRTGASFPPARVTAQGMTARSVLSAAAGRFAGAAIAADGSVIAWGEGLGGATGQLLSGLPPGSAPLGVDIGSAPSPLVWLPDGSLYSGAPALALVPGASGVVQASVSVPVSGASSSYFRRGDGALFAWGRNNSGQLGLGDTVDRAAPTVVPLPPGDTVVSVSAGADHALMATAGGSFSAVGSNLFGQLGTGDTTGRDTFGVPVLITRWP